MIDVNAFAGIQDIYISPDPQEHRPAWIWFACIGEDFAVAAGRGEKSSWWGNRRLYLRQGKFLLKSRFIRSCLNLSLLTKKSTNSSAHKKQEQVEVGVLSGKKRFVRQFYGWNL